MSGLSRGLTLLAVLWGLAGGCAQTAMAQVPTTTVQDTVYNASGAPAAGTVVVSWSSFTTAGGSAVPAGSTSVTIGAGGALSIALAPNAGATPMGSYYTAVFHLSDGTTSKEYWVVPVTVPGGGPAKLAGIENSVLPTSVAMQTVSKQYVDNAIAEAQIGDVPLTSSPYVLKAGDTMTGPLVLPADPVSPLQAADKNYVDENVAALSGGIGQTVKTFPTATQTVVQPSGTELAVNNLNGVLYASQYASSSSSTGIANAETSPDCGSTCKVLIEPTYNPGDPLGLGNFQNGLAVEDQRGGADAGYAVNPLGPATAFSAAKSTTQFATMSQQQLDAVRPGAQAIGVAAEQLTTVALTGGSNLFPAEIESPPYFKSTYGVLTLNGIYNTQGQHIQLNSDVVCYSVGDCLAGSQFISSSGGYRDNSDEGTHPYDLQVAEDYHVFGGLCAGGCSTGSTVVTITPTNDGGTQGDGRFLIDTLPSKVISGNTLIGGGHTIFALATFSGTSFPVSVFLSTAQAVTSQADNMAPGTVTVAIATTALASGFATSTAALPASTGVACLADPDTLTQFPNYEMGNYTVVDATHLQLTLNKPHRSGAVIAVGGLCGYGVEQTIDDVNLVKQVFPVVGSFDGTDLYYAAGLTPVIGGTPGAPSTSGYLNASGSVASIARTGGIVSVTLTGNLPGDVNGLTFTVSGVADPSYNGSYAVTTTGGNSFTYASAGADSTSSGGAVSLVTGGFNLYPMAEVLSVANPATSSVDGTFVLAPNTVAWGAGDSVEEPHYHQQNTSADTEIVSQFVPRPIQYVSAGKTYEGNVTAGLRGWEVNNAAGAGYYLGGGGTHNLPDDAYVAAGAWRNDFELDAGAQSLIYAHCNAVMGCNRWDSTYDLFLLDSAAGSDLEQYEPQNSTVTWSLRGVPYSFSPTAFTARTIDVGTLNATTITGGVSGAAINSGTISAERLPLFGPSGTTHAPGIVPDPGATAGATRYLREDGTWDVPAGGGGGGGGGGGSPSGAAGGDLSGTYPNPTVGAVHAGSSAIGSVTVPVTAATDDSSNAASTSYVHSYLPVVQLSWYATDNTSVDSCATITAAVNAVPAGGTLRVSPVTSGYTATASSTCPAGVVQVTKPLHIVCDSPGVYVASSNTWTTPAPFYNMGFQGTDVDMDASNCGFNSLTNTNGSNAITIGTGSGSTLTNTNSRNNIITMSPTTAGQHGILYQGVNGGKATHNSIYYGQHAIACRGSNCVIDGNLTYYQTADHIILKASQNVTGTSAYNNANGSVVSNNVIVGAGTGDVAPGVLVQSDTAGTIAYGNTITGNTFSSSQYGSAIDENVTTTGASVEGSIIANNTSTATGGYGCDATGGGTISGSVIANDVFSNGTGSGYAFNNAGGGCTNLQLINPSGAGNTGLVNGTFGGSNAATVQTTPNGQGNTEVMKYDASQLPETVDYGYTGSTGLFYGGRMQWTNQTSNFSGCGGWHFNVGQAVWGGGYDGAAGAETSFNDVFCVDGGGDLFSNSVVGPATAPTGSCPVNGAWAFTKDGHATFCSGGTWVTKL
jgi:hypothetical protein